MNLIRIYEHGGPEVLRWEAAEIGEPGPGEVRVRHTAVGLNFLDTYFRTGLYPVPQLPFTPGSEAAGVVEAVGSGVTELKVGDRIAYGTAPFGAYAEQRVLPAEKLVKLPDQISDETGAAMMLKGMTAHYLLHRSYQVRPGETILVHAAAGGVGTLLCQWAKHIGATVIGTVGNDEKAEYARSNGCDYPIIYSRENFVERVHEITGGKGVPVVYDSVGQATFMQSLDCLQPLGMMVLFGQSSGAVAPFDPGLLAAKGSLFLTRPTLNHYAGDAASLQRSAGALMDMVASGKLQIRVDQRIPLKDAADAQRQLEARQTTAATVLVP